MLIFWGSFQGVQGGAWNETRNWRDYLPPEDGDVVDLCGGVMTVGKDEATVVGITFINGTLNLSAARCDHMRSCIIGMGCSVIPREENALVETRS